MALLSFTVRNHKSIRDEVTIDLMRPSLRTLQPKDGNWDAVIYPIAGIFGGNATGKSALLDAVRHTFEAIRFSATKWQASRSMWRYPFFLDGTEHTASSVYELEFVHDSRRYLYGFEIDPEGVKREWLRDVPSSRWRTLLNRDRATNTLKVHPSLSTKIEVTGRELVLSRALLLENSPLQPIAKGLVSGFDCVLVKDSHRAERLTSIADSLADGSVTFGDLEALLQVADIGIVKVDIEETNPVGSLGHDIRDLLRIIRFGGAFPNENGGERGQTYPSEERLAQVVKHLVFTHRGAGDESPKFSIEDESDGTIAWLAIAVPALEVLREGGLLLIDEIDASLHPHLIELLLGAFADPQINRNLAQLIFTSHETYILSPLNEVKLEPEQVWFTDKTYEGVTELTCLADFPKHPDANVARRYLTGRYGGTPRLSPSTLAVLVGVGDS